jgi:hypothetical protein
MPLQNRVTPWGEIVATPERGLFMGNRGCLHDGQRRVTKAWARTPWVTCLLEFKDRHRAVMSPGQYTELFFLDEATALAAGHRPCATCRRADYDAFKALWLEANPELAERSGGKTTEIDKLMHAERVDARRQKRTWSARLEDLPDGSMVVLLGTRDPLLIWGGQVHTWTPGGYTAARPLDPGTELEVLTPPSVVKTLGHGYRPVVHPSAEARSG